MLLVQLFRLRAVAGRALLLFQPTPHPAASPALCEMSQWVPGALRSRAHWTLSFPFMPGTLQGWSSPLSLPEPIVHGSVWMIEAATLIVLLTEFSPPWFSRKDPGAITTNPIKFLLVGFLITVARQSSGNTSRSSEWWVLGGEGASPPCCLLSHFLKLSNLGVIWTNCWRGTWSILWETVVSIHHLETSLGRTCCWCGIYFAASVSCLNLPDALFCPFPKTPEVA